MPTPWLSVIIPTYNGAAFLSAALASIAAQDDQEIECLLVDDGSTDATLAIVNRFAEAIPIVVHPVPRSGNWALNSNLALEKARGDYACFLHQDDFWLANRLATLRALVGRYPKAEFLLSPAIFVDQQGRAVGRWSCPLPNSAGPISSDGLIERLLVQNFIAMPSPVFRRQAAIDSGGLDPALWYTADWHLWLTLARQPTVYSPLPLAAFRLHPQSQTVRRSLDLASFEQQMETVLERHLATAKLDEPRRKQVEQAARFSVQMNTALAARLHGLPLPTRALLRTFLSLGPSGWQRYLRDSRISDRILSRVRATIHS